MVDRKVCPVCNGLGNISVQQTTDVKPVDGWKSHYVDYAVSSYDICTKCWGTGYIFIYFWSQYIPPSHNQDNTLGRQESMT